MVFEVNFVMALHVLRLGTGLVLLLVILRVPSPGIVFLFQVNYHYVFLAEIVLQIVDFPFVVTPHIVHLGFKGLDLHLQVLHLLRVNVAVVLVSHFFQFLLSHVVFNFQVLVSPL